MSAGFAPRHRDHLMLAAARGLQHHARKQPRRRSRQRDRSVPAN